MLFRRGGEGQGLVCFSAASSHLPLPPSDMMQEAADSRCLARLAGLLHQKKLVQPWLVWLSGLSDVLQTKGLPVRFPVRVDAWVAVQAPIWGHVRGNKPHIDVSLPRFLPPFL